jgi:putative SOS response-associated peptidase YedK
MPVILTKETEKVWLDDQLTTEAHREILQPCDPQDVLAYRVSTKVNSVRNDNPDLILPAKHEGFGGTLSLFEPN